MSISMYETRKMLRALEQMLPAKKFLRDLFFSEVDVSQSKYVDIDIIKGTRKLAPFVHPLKEGRMVEKEGYKTRSYEPPYVKPKTVTTAADILNRDPGKHIYQRSETPAQAAARKLGKELNFLNSEIDRLEEWMCASALSNGSITVVGEGVNDVIDFGMESSHKPVLAGGDLWSDATNSNPMQDLKDWDRLIAKDSGMKANVIVMGFTAWDTFVQHPKVTGALDTRRVDLGKIDPMALPNGATYQGYMKEVQCDVYTYNEWYTNASDTTLPMIDAKKVIMGDTRCRATRHYGAIQDLEALAAVRRFPKSWMEKDPSVRMLLLQSAPLMALHQVDAVVAATVLA